MQGLKNSFFVLFDNLDYFGIYVLIFIAVSALCYTIISLVNRSRKETRKRLSKLIDEKSSDKATTDRPKLMHESANSLAIKISKPLHRISSIEKPSTRQKIQLKLVRAGYRSNSAIYNYLAAKIILPLFFVGIYMVTRIFYNVASELLLSLALLILMGYLTPSVWVWLMTKARQERIFKGLPDALDLMVVCVESGLGLDMTFKRVGDEVRELCKDLGDEFTLTNLEVKAGKQRDEAFRNMATRTGVPEVNNLMTVLVQTSRFGTSLAKALRIHADAMRVKRRQMAEEIAAKATVKLIFPLIFCIFPAIFVVLIGPGAIKIVRNLFPVLSGGG
ncbi:MAG: type II secretion system F family protein [Desulfuromonadales bacterium]|nr:type II secretion system F family protein [Desulfuromonadales bacterium]